MPDISPPGLSGGPFCRCCAVCCRKGGPSLHREDSGLIYQGILGRAHLVTLRRGELVLDPVQDAPIRLDAECLKIKGAGQGWTCIFLENATGLCSIHSSRPAECKALFCTDTAELLAMYRKDRLTRFDLIDPCSALGEIIAAHEVRCGLERLAEAARDYLAHGGGTARDAIVEALRYDLALRELLCDRAGLAAGELDFYLGRALRRVLPSIGLCAVGREPEMVLIKAQPGELHA